MSDIRFGRKCSVQGSLSNHNKTRRSYSYSVYSIFYIKYLFILFEDDFFVKLYFFFQRDAFPNGFYIVLIVTGEDNYCFSKFLGNEYDRTKSVTVQLSKSISSSDYKIAVLLTLLVLSLFCTLMFTVFYYNYNK